MKTLSDNPCSNMWLAVIERAINDLTNKDEDIKISAEKWFKNKDSSFVLVCDHIGIDSSAVLNKLNF